MRTMPVCKMCVMTNQAKVCEASAKTNFVSYHLLAIYTHTLQ